jgi:hypothetical protein
LDHFRYRSGNLRGYLSLELIFLDKILANQSVGDIIEISQFVELAFSMRARCAETFLYAYTAPHITISDGFGKKVLIPLSAKSTTPNFEPDFKPKNRR